MFGEFRSHVATLAAQLVKSAFEIDRVPKGSVANPSAPGLDGSERGGSQAMSDFKGRHFEGEIVLWAVRWYCRYGVSYRDLEQMMGERGVSVDHSTIYRVGALLMTTGFSQAFSPVSDLARKRGTLGWIGTDHGRCLEGDRRRCLLNNSEARARSSRRPRPSPPRGGKPPPNSHEQMAQSCGRQRGIGEVAFYFLSARSRRARPQESFAQSLVDNQEVCATRSANRSDGIPSVPCDSS